MPNQLPKMIEERILSFSIAHPGLGPKRVAGELRRPKWGAIVVSPNGVWKVPDQVVALQGPPSLPLAFDLDGRVDSVHGGIRNTFEAAPDAPVEKFVLEMQGGRKGLIVNSTDLCRKKNRAKAKLAGHARLTGWKPDPTNMAYALIGTREKSSNADLEGEPQRRRLVWRSICVMIGKICGI